MSVQPWHWREIASYTTANTPGPTGTAHRLATAVHDLTRIAETTARAARHSKNSDLTPSDRQAIAYCQWLTGDW